MHMHTFRLKKGCRVSLNILKSMDEIPGHGPLHKEKWTGP